MPFATAIWAIGLSPLSVMGRALPRIASRAQPWSRMIWLIDWRRSPLHRMKSSWWRWSGACVRLFCYRRRHRIFPGRFRLYRSGRVAGRDCLCDSAYWRWCCGARSGCRTALLLPENGEYANQTWFLTSDDWREHLHISPFSGRATRLVMMTDGVQPFALNRRGDALFSPFIDPVLRYLQQSSEAEEAKRYAPRWMTRAPGR